MKKEFKTPEIEVRSMNAVEAIMLSDQALNQGGISNTSAMFAAVIDDTAAAAYSHWKSYTK